MARAVEEVSVAERSNGINEGIHAVKKRSELRVALDSMNEDVTMCNQARTVFAHLIYRLQSSLKHRVTCTLILTQRITSKRPPICLEIVGSSSKSKSFAMT